MHSTISNALKAEYEERGFIRQSFSLDPKSDYRELIQDSSLFRSALKKNKELGVKQVPYIVTKAIREVTDDLKLNEILGLLLNGERWVMWGANIREGTPNEAHLWHVDLESWLWSTITVAIGIDGCSPASSTWILPGSHKFSKCPPSSTNPDIQLASAFSEGQRHTQPEQFSGFGNGRFYLFNAKCWHRGQIETSLHRVVLFLHFHRASDPRIPLMVDYDKQQWSSQPAPYIAGKGSGKVQKNCCKLPLKYRISRAINSMWSLKK